MTTAGRTRFFTGGPESDAGRRFAEGRGYSLASVGVDRRVDLEEVSAEAVQAAYTEAERHAGGTSSSVLPVPSRIS